MANAVRWDLIADPRKFQKGFKEAERSTHQLGASMKRFAGIAAAGFAAAGVAQFAKDSVTLAATFDRTMRQTAAVAKVPTDQLGKLRDVALDMGAKTSFSAKQASDAMLELAKGGLTAAQIKTGGLQATLTLAAAGGLELGAAAGFVVKSLNTFGLEVDRAADVAAALAGGANASTTSVEDLGLALSQVGPGAKGAGLSLQETVGVLASFADHGIESSDAGTSLKTMLTRLVPTTKEAASTMRKLGLDFTDAKGQIIPIAAVAQQLQDKLKGLSEEQRTTALATIFGSDATRAASVLIDEGAKGLAPYIQATKDRGAAEKLAKTNTEGASGAFERLKGAVETVQIKIGDKLLPVLADTATTIADKVIPNVEKYFARLSQDLRPELDRMKKAWDDNSGALRDLLTTMFKGDEQFSDTAEQAKSLSDSVVTVTETLGKVAWGLKATGEALNTLDAVMEISGHNIHVNYVRPFIGAMGQILDKVMWAQEHIAGASATIAEALHQPQADALRKAEQRIRQFRKTFNAELDQLGDESVVITANFGWKGLEVFRTKSGRAMFAVGGRVDGPGTETSDSVLARLSRGEFVINAAAARTIGYGELERLNAMRFAAGGPVGATVTQHLPPASALTGRLDRFEATIGRILTLATTALNNTVGSGVSIPHAPGAWRLATSFLRGLGLPFDIISTFRPGARTRASGRQSYHALNRAVDLTGPNMGALFSALNRTNPTELLYSRAPFYIAGGIRKAISRLDPITRADHYSHVHAAYNAGTPYVPRTGAYLLHRGERVTSAANNARGGGGGGEIHVHLHGDVYGDRQALVREVRSGIRAAQRRDGIPAAQQVR